MPRKAAPQHRSGCPVSISLEVFGDRWSLLIVRDLMVRGFQRFQDFVESGEGIATNILADRLRRLQCAGVVEAEHGPGGRAAGELSAHAERDRSGAGDAGVADLGRAAREQTGAPAELLAHMAANREAILKETRRRWKDRDPTPILPWLGGPRRLGSEEREKVRREPVRFPGRQRFNNSQSGYGGKSWRKQRWERGWTENDSDGCLHGTVVDGQGDRGSDSAVLPFRRDDEIRSAQTGGRCVCASGLAACICP